MPGRALQPGDPAKIGDYAVSARLGAGGMGEVFFGRSPGGRPVAIKLVRAEYAADPEFRRRFEREVRLAKRVGGHYSAQVVDADFEAERPWMVTAYIPGPSLAQVLADRSRLPDATVRALGAGLAEALGAVHAEEGLIHRDLKPSNILLAKDGPRLIDFGIARAADASGITARAGTPGFMSPELLTGEALTPACDVFAFGLVLAHAAGVKPFGEGPARALDYRIVEKEPDLSGLAPDLAEIVRACLAKDPQDRPTAQTLLVRLAGSGPPEGWLPADVQTEIDRHEASVHETRSYTRKPQNPVLQPPDYPEETVYRKRDPGEAGVTIFGMLCAIAWAFYGFFPGVLDGKLYPNSFSPDPSAWGIGFAAFGVLLLFLALSMLPGDFDNWNRLQVGPNCIDVTLGQEHHEYEWADIVGMTVMAWESKAHVCCYLRTVTVSEGSESQRRRSDQRAESSTVTTVPCLLENGWTVLFRLDKFGVHPRVVMKSLARFAGPVWEGPPEPPAPLLKAKEAPPPRQLR